MEDRQTLISKALYNISEDVLEGKYGKENDVDVPLLLSVICDVIREVIKNTNT